jgi:hypothetical protein
MTPKTPSRRFSIIRPTSVLAGMIVILTGCGPRVQPVDPNWTTPINIGSSVDSIVGWPELYRCFNSIIYVQYAGDGAVSCLMLNLNVTNGNPWAEIKTGGIPSGYTFAPTVDQSSGTMLFPQQDTDTNQSSIRVLVAQVTANGRFQIETERKWTVDTSEFFGGSGIDIQRTPGPLFGRGILSEANAYIPYTDIAESLTSFGLTEGPFNNGVFYSSDSATTWQTVTISTNGDWLDPLVSKSEDNYYYFAIKYPRYELVSYRKSPGDNSWGNPETLSKTYAKTAGLYAAVAEGDTVHVCWMDCRNDMWRFNIDGPNIENDDIAYCHRKDSDNKWSNDIILSKGVRYCYAPCISAEGNNVVMAWAGISSAGKHHTEYSENDIYYVTSKDGGNTWSKPLRATDGAKDGLDSARPQVILLNGTIHLVYIQGKLEKPDELSSGLTAPSKQPWPIYYTQRPFPN